MKTVLRCLLATVFLCITVSALAGTTSVNGQSLTIALVHFKVQYKEPARNLEELKKLHREAAAKGAKIIFNTELALTGYSFSSREDIRPFTQTVDSRLVREIADLAKELAVYIGITFPERDVQTDSFYNAAAVFSPQGKLVCNYHKIYGEKRWARPGSPYQNNLFLTPWGMVGVVICADSYFDLIPRTLALKGADLIWVPANWPPMGQLSPVDIWSIRAMENGVYLAACNRTGKDKTMDCSKAESAVIAPDGTPLVSRSSEESALLFANISLDENGQISKMQRKQKMGTRNVALYRQLYLDPWTENLTMYYQLPDPGKILLHSLTSAQNPLDIGAIEAQVAAESSPSPALWLLPQTGVDVLNKEKLQAIARSYNCAFALSVRSEQGNVSELLITKEGIQSFTDAKGELPYRLLRFGPAAVAMVPLNELRHPELGVVLAKLGCDLVLVSEPELSALDIRLAKVRTIDNFAIAASGSNRAVIAQMKGVHGDIQVQMSDNGRSCVLELDTVETRSKEFYDRVDFDVLLRDDKGELKNEYVQ
ncbi:carbon-nitrogen hydrolase family protein [Desulfogranum japonicum]|uniref:carbon-nitrogen hydrolase family protein n=1 Tax=Desulfogranum japonicum TaxID=231447 RepID=UPI0004188916|nr:carbon-nitrogen hydrolase family protein [Desulfogranum japonicum]